MIRIRRTLALQKVWLALNSAGFEPSTDELLLVAIIV